MLPFSKERKDLSNPTSLTNTLGGFTLIVIDLEISAIRSVMSQVPIDLPCITPLVVTVATVTSDELHCKCSTGTEAPDGSTAKPKTSVAPTSISSMAEASTPLGRVKIMD